MDHIRYVGCGDTSMLVLINPMKVVGIGEKKGRCYEYFPVMTVPTDEVTELLHDKAFDTLELDCVYAIEELENLEEKAKESFAVEARKHDFNLPQITSTEIRTITDQLTSMKDQIKNRVVHYDI